MKRRHRFPPSIEPFDAIVASITLLRQAVPEISWS
jgi:hypothetical protein